MSTWMWIAILTLGLVKIPIAALMLWLPFRADEALAGLPADEPSSGEDEGGSKVPPGTGRDLHPRPPRRGPRVPRRGPHGSPAPLAPARVRTRVGGRRRTPRVSV
jgi:hypothetical protein